MAICFCPTSSPHWRETLSTGQRNDYLDVYIFPVFVLENFCPHAFVCTQSADFVRKYLTYCFPALFVFMYIVTLSDVVHSFKFWLWGECGHRSSTAYVFFVNEHKLLVGYTYGDFLNIFMLWALNCGDSFFFLPSLAFMPHSPSLAASLIA